MAITSRRGTQPRARLTRQGQITIPKAVRDALALNPGDELEFEVNDGQAVVRPRQRRTILDFAGIAGDRSRFLPRTARELDEVIEKGNAERARRRFEA